MVRRIAGLPEGEIFIVPQQGMVVANRITKTDVVPFEGDQAIQRAAVLAGEEGREVAGREDDRPVGEVHADEYDEGV